MLETPLGKIRVLRNGKEIEYSALKYNAVFAEAKENLLRGVIE